MLQNKEATVQNGLMELTRGMTKAGSVFNRSTYESDLLTQIINSEIGEGYVQEKYRDLFPFSFDEVGVEFQRFSEEFLGEEFSADYSIERNEYKTLAIGLDQAVEGIEEIVAVCREDKETKRALKNFGTDYFQPFSEDGFTMFLKKMKGFRWAYLAEVNKQIGHHQLVKKLGTTE